MATKNSKLQPDPFVIKIVKIDDTKYSGKFYSYYLGSDSTLIQKYERAFLAHIAEILVSQTEVLLTVIKS